MIKVLINGANGKMGQAASAAIAQHQQLQLVARAVRGDDLTAKINASACDVVIELTNAHAVYQNAITIIQAGVCPVIGATGLSTEQIAELQARCQQKQLGGIIAPNFSIGAVLMMKFAQDAAKYFPDVEIIEQHHHQKQDYPSGTAIYTANLINQQKAPRVPLVDELATLPGARGSTVGDIKIHSVRIPGLIAKQEVVFGGHHEVLSIKQEANSRECFMPGLCLCVEKVITLSELVVGLEHLL